MEIQSDQTTRIKVKVSEIVERLGFVKGDYLYVNSMFCVGQNGEDDAIEMIFTRQAKP